ncbi:hypothetical protein V1521DRAFT_3063 [Lipomyces starkeyi]
MRFIVLCKLIICSVMSAGCYIVANIYYSWSPALTLNACFASVWTSNLLQCSPIRMDNGHSVAASKRTPPTGLFSCRMQRIISKIYRCFTTCLFCVEATMELIGTEYKAAWREFARYKKTTHLQCRTA